MSNITFVKDGNGRKHEFLRVGVFYFSDSRRDLVAVIIIKIKEHIYLEIYRIFNMLDMFFILI
jgi:hypothetical protein